MQADTGQQRLEIASSLFPYGSKVCNFKLGSVGRVASSPMLGSSGDITLTIIYEFGRCEENMDSLIPIREIKRSRQKNA